MVLADELLSNFCCACNTNMVIVDVKNAQVLLVLEAVGKGVSASVSDLIVIKEEHVQANVSAQSISQACRATIIDSIFAQVHSLNGRIKSCYEHFVGFKGNLL